MPEKQGDISRGLSYSTVPVPDPTKLTTDATNKLEAQIRREMDLHKELIESKLCRLEDITNVKFDDRDAALDATLQTGKEAISKSETATADQIRQLNALFQTSISAQSERISKLESDNARQQATAMTLASQTTMRTASGGNMISVVSIAVGVLIAVVTIAVAILVKR